MELKGSRTHANLMAAFAGETQARTKYTYYSDKAKTDGFEDIAKIFKETSHNEKAHAEMWFKRLHNGIGATEINLEDAANGEHFEWSTMYREFAEQAREEGFLDIAFEFEQVAKIEKFHEERYLKYLAQVKANKVFIRDEEVTWKCENCGHEHKGTTAPDVCPVCKYPKAYFKEGN